MQEKDKDKNMLTNTEKDYIVKTAYEQAYKEAATLKQRALQAVTALTVGGAGGSIPSIVGNTLDKLNDAKAQGKIEFQKGQTEQARKLQQLPGRTSKDMNPYRND